MRTIVAFCVRLALQYRKEVAELNEAIGRRPAEVLARGAAHESARVQALEEENADLRTSLMANQQAMKMIMTKYKEQVASFEHGGLARNHAFLLQMIR